MNIPTSGSSLVSLPSKIRKSCLAGPCQESQIVFSPYRGNKRGKKKLYTLSFLRNRPPSNWFILKHPRRATRAQLKAQNMQNFNRSTRVSEFQYPRFPGFTHFSRTSTVLIYSFDAKTSCTNWIKENRSQNRFRDLEQMPMVLPN